MNNIDRKTVEGFGDEWTRFDQSGMKESELRDLFDRYFDIFPWEAIPNNAVGFDLGCGSGRWAKLVSEKVGLLHCIDASEEAINVAKINLKNMSNCMFHHASVDNMSIKDQSMDFGYSIGVLHHVPDTFQGIQTCASKLKSGAPFLIYLYYAFDNKPFWFRVLWKISDLLRRVIARMPKLPRYLLSQIVAVLIYYPLARISLFLEKLTMDVSNCPLSFYRDKNFYTMRTDALDRFGALLEKRFARDEIEVMMKEAGLQHIMFSESLPYWNAVGFKK